MIYYIIKNKRNGRYISGTDFRYSPPCQIFADAWSAPRLFCGYELEREISHRKINLKRYEIVAAEIQERR